jgi:hypothetical protein
VAHKGSLVTLSYELVQEDTFQGDLQQADCYLYVLELTKKKFDEKVVIPAIKGWLENKIRRK